MRSVIVPLGATVSILFAGGASAAKVSEAQLRYQEERAVCMSGASNQDRGTCLREAGAALQEARRGNLATDNQGDIGHNRMVRCDALPAQDRQDCAIRMQGHGSSSGSAEQGGVLLELERTVPAH